MTSKVEIMPNYKIRHVLNNNVIVAIDDQHVERVMMGKGLGFQKSPGDDYDPVRVEKQFVHSAGNDVSMLSQLLSEIPLAVMTTTEKIVAHAKSFLTVPLNSSVSIALMDHLNCALQRHQQGVCLTNSFMWEMTKFYSQELQVGRDALSIIQSRLDVTLPDEEAGFIAFHLIQAQLDSAAPLVREMTQMIRDILNIVKYHFSLDYDESCYYYQRFMTHLKFFAQRVLQGETLHHQDNRLFYMLKDQYKEATLCISKIESHMDKTYQHTLACDEKLFLSIHIERLRLAQHQAKDKM